jgi:hypothetical protein
VQRYRHQLHVGDTPPRAGARCERQDAAEDRAFARAVAKEKRDKAKAGIVEPASDQPESDRVFTPEEEAKMWAKVGAALNAGSDAVRAKMRRGRE